MSISCFATQVAGVVTNKRKIACNTVVIATGAVPGKTLAETAGIEVNRGIRVNERMETSVEDIYACGDCVETVDACTGEDASYVGAYAFARIHFLQTHAVTFGKTMRGTECLLGDMEVIEREDGKNYLRIILLDGRGVGGQARRRPFDPRRTEREVRNLGRTSEISDPSSPGMPWGQTNRPTKEQRYQ